MLFVGLTFCALVGLQTLTRVATTAAHPKSVTSMPNEISQLYIGK